MKVTAGRYTKVLDDKMFQKAYKLAKGFYQKALVLGNDSLAEKLKTSDPGLQRSFTQLFGKMERKGIKFEVKVDGHKVKVLVIGVK